MHSDMERKRPVVGVEKKIPFNIAPYTGKENQYVLDAMQGREISGDGKYSRKCQTWFESQTGCVKCFLTPSCTHALELAAILINVQPGDEIIMPSYTFVSTANAFVLRGAKIVFVDVRPGTMNMNEDLVECAITRRTRAIVPVHYAGTTCDMDTITAIAEKHGLFVIEDAAQGMCSTYKGKTLGTLGHLGAYSFHETKNVTSGGEGGLLLINEVKFIERAEILREKGTDRSRFFRGMVDKYSWVDMGSSFLLSDLQAAYLWGQLKEVEKIQKDRFDTWNYYRSELHPLVSSGKIEIAEIPGDCEHNAHMFWLKLEDLEQRSEFISYLLQHGIVSVFHYVPLHSAAAGSRFGRFNGVDACTTRESERLVRLPLWYGIGKDNLDPICEVVTSYFEKRG